jgi:N-hydroxyarylamine O-acetyltransferase
VANHFTPTHPSSPFLGCVVVVREDEHSRTRLLDRELGTTRPDGSTSRRTVADGELPVLLGERFGITLDDEEITAQRTKSETNALRRRDRLGGLLHEYQQVA